MRKKSAQLRQLRRELKRLRPSISDNLLTTNTTRGVTRTPRATSTTIRQGGGTDDLTWV